MKKLLTLLTLTALLLCGCADMGDPADTPQEPGKTTIATTTATATIAVTDIPPMPVTSTTDLNAPITPGETTTSQSSAPILTPDPSEPSPPTEQITSAGFPAELLPVIVQKATEEEIASIQTFFADPYVAALLCCESFTQPEDIDLSGFIYSGVYLPDESHPNGRPTQEEIQAIALGEDSAFLLNADCYRWTADELDNVLTKYLGISFTDEIGANMLDLRLETERDIPNVWYYSPTDAYYLFHTDSGRATPALECAWRSADGKYLVQYTGACDSMVVLLNSCENSYTIEMIMDITQ